MKHSIKIENSSYSDNEILWLIKNIGNKNPDIRDSLVYNILTTGITEEKFTTTQFYTIVQSTITNNLILFNIAEKLPSTLTRSFSALLNGNIIFADGNTKSKYYNSLSGEEKKYFFLAQLLTCILNMTILVILRNMVGFIVLHMVQIFFLKHCAIIYSLMNQLK